MRKSFVAHIDHLVQYTHYFTDHKILLLLDNPEAYISLQVIEKARQNGIIMLTIPPKHCIVSAFWCCCFFPFNNKYNRAMDNWIKNHPGQTATTYNIPSLVGKVQLSAIITLLLLLL